MPNSEDRVSKSLTTSPRAPWRLIALIGCLAATGGIAVFFLAAHLSELHAVEERYRPARQVDLSDTATLDRVSPRDAGASKLTLRVAISPVISPESSLPLYRALVEHLAKALDRKPVILQRRTYAEVNHLVQYRQCDLAFVCTWAFVKGEREFGMELLAAPVVDGSCTYRSFVIVPKGSPAKSLLDLRGQRFASADQMSNTGWLYPATWLKERGFNPETFFSNHVITGSHDRSVTVVMSRLVDGAAVDHLVYEHMARRDPSIRVATRVIQRSPAFGMPPVVTDRTTDEGLKLKLRTALLRMHSTPEGRRALSPVEIERFVVPDAKLYDSVREAARQHEGRRE